MSHGHKHEEYRQQALKMGGTPNGTKGLYVLCDGEAPKSGQEMRCESRFFCMVRRFGDACDTCENSRFTLTFQVGLMQQQVACPRWHSLDDKLNHKKPFYVHQSRELCFRDPPRECRSYCPSCVNNKPDKPPEDREGWWEERAKQYGTVYR